MTHRIGLLMLIEGASFVIAALVPGGVLFPVYEHQRASIAESVIGTVLIVGAALTWVRPTWLRRVGIAAQGFALLGTMIGVYTVAIGVGPRTMPDIAYHFTILAVLALGLSLSMRMRPTN